MCLAVMGKVLEVSFDEPWAVVETFGLKQRVGTHLVSEVCPGEYLMIHAGYAIEKIDSAEAQKWLHLWKEIIKHDGG